MNTPVIFGYGSLLDIPAMNGSQPEIGSARRQGLNLFYFYRPPNSLRRGRINISMLAKQAYAEAVKRGEPFLVVDPGEQVPLKFRFAREIEVATVVAWPDGDVWARIGLSESRSTAVHKAFVRSSGLELPVADKRLSPLRQRQATALAIALIAIVFAKPLPPYPPIDQNGRSARDMAHEAGGLDALLHSWK